jgi:hypothetical protein
LSAIPIAAIAGAIAGALVLTAAIVGAILFRRRRRDRRPTSESDDSPRDLEFVNSTLHETLVTYSDTMTVDGAPLGPRFSFPDSGSDLQSLI